MLTTPPTRNCVSVNTLMTVRVRRIPAGLRNGKTPSNTNNKATAAHKSCHSMGIRLRQLTPWIFKVAEEIGAGINHQDVVFVLEAFLVGVETAI